MLSLSVLVATPISFLATPLLRTRLSLIFLPYFRLLLLFHLLCFFLCQSQTAESASQPSRSPPQNRSAYHSALLTSLEIDNDSSTGNLPLVRVFVSVVEILFAFELNERVSLRMAFRVADDMHVSHQTVSLTISHNLPRIRVSALSRWFCSSADWRTTFFRGCSQFRGF
jgi:hypothetical protein